MPSDMLQRIQERRGGKPIGVTATSPAPDAAAESQQPEDYSGILNTLSGLSTGVGKGALESVGGLGKILRMIPGIDSLDKLMTPVDVDVEAKGTPEKVGKFAEGVGEFFLPGMKAGKLGLTKQLVKHIPDSLGPKAMKVANKAAAYTGRIGGEGIQAGALAGIHGGDVDSSAELGAGGQAGVESLTQLTRLLNTTLGKKLAPIMAAGGVMAGTGLNAGGVGASFGTYAALREAIKQGLMGPGVVRSMQRGVQKGGPVVTRSANVGLRRRVENSDEQP